VQSVPFKTGIEPPGAEEGVVIRFQLELFGVAWVVVSEVSPLAPHSEDDEIVETYSTTGFCRNEEEEE